MATVMKKTPKKKAKAGGNRPSPKDPSKASVTPENLPGGAAGLQSRLAPVTLYLSLADVKRDGQNHRLKSPAVKQAVQERAESFERNGQLTPISVYDQGKGVHPRYLLDSGFIRCAAAELLEWAAIRAEVHPMPDDQAVMEQTRAAENLDRLNLNPMEEAVAVAQMVAACEGDVAAAAVRLGRSETWVRDRAYLDRLCPKVRQMVMEGTLPLGYAREIAKLGDPADQEALAAEARTHENGRVYRSLEEIRRYAEDRMRSLRIVPWKLDAEFPSNRRIVGACVGCSFNSATDRNLFEHDDKAPEDGLCLKGDCFEAKQSECHRAIEKAVDRIVKQELPATERGVAQVAEAAKAEFVKPATIARAAKKREDGVQPATKSSQRKQPQESWEEKVRNAQWKYQDACRAWAREAAEVVYEHAAKTPGFRFALWLAGHTALGNWDPKPKEIERAKTLVVPLFEEGAITPALVAFEKASGDRLQAHRLDSEKSAIRDYFAKLWGLVFEPKPELAAFMPKKPDSSPAPAQSKGKKAKRSREVGKIIPVGDAQTAPSAAAASVPANVAALIAELPALEQPFAREMWAWLTTAGGAEPTSTLHIITRQTIAESLEQAAAEAGVALDPEKTADPVASASGKEGAFE